MVAPSKLFLDYNSLAEEWKVLSDKGMVFGSGCCPEDAIASARVVTNNPIYANSEFKGLIDGTPVIPEMDITDIPEDTTLYGREEIIEALAELGGFRVHKVVEAGCFIGYTMELVE